jgi:hypothetical protein
MSSAPELQQRAIEYAKAGDFGPQALATNLELAKLAPTNEGALTRLSRCYMEGGQLDEATVTLDAVLQLNPQNMIARSLQTEVTRRRIGSTVSIKPKAVRERKPRESTSRESKPRKSGSANVPGLGRAEFVALGQLAGKAAVESLGGRIEPLLIALNERPFAARAVEARNPTGQSGARLFRRNTLRSTGSGQLEAFHLGGRFEPQLNVGLLSATPWGRDAVRAGIAFDLAPEEPELEADRLGRERAIAAFARFQQHAGSTWRSFLAQWMATNGGFVQIGRTPPSTDLMPNDALAKLIACQAPVEVDWIFFGRWLFLDRANDAEMLADGRRLVAWIETSFTDLLPLWTSLYRP